MGWQFNFGIFLLGTVITIVIVSLSCGLLLIQLQNNEMLKDIQKNTRHNHILKDIQKNTEK